jgi:hypothetical protein
MWFLVFFAVQGLGDIDGSPPRGEFLNFVFVHDDKRDDVEWKIRGTSMTSTEWSKSTFLGLVRKCGGRQWTAASIDSRSIRVTGESGARSRDIVRCVKAGTSVRFAATVEYRAYGTVQRDIWSFRDLWDR